MLIPSDNHVRPSFERTFEDAIIIGIYCNIEGHCWGDDVSQPPYLLSGKMQPVSSETSMSIRPVRAMPNRRAPTPPNSKAETYTFVSSVTPTSVSER